MGAGGNSHDPRIDNQGIPQHRSSFSSTILGEKQTYNLPFVTAAHSDTDRSDVLASAGRL